MSRTKRDEEYIAILRQDLLWPRDRRVPVGLKPMHIRFLLLEAYVVGAWAHERCDKKLRQRLKNAIWKGVI